MISFDRFFPRRIWQQVLLIVLALVTIPMIILGFLLVQTAHNALQDVISRDLKQIAVHTSGEVLKEYAGAGNALNVTASILGTLHAEQWRQETVVVQLALKNPALRNVCSYDLAGHPLACSNLDYSTTRAIDPWVLECLKTQPYCASNVRTSSDHLPVMDLAVGIYRFGKIDGTLTAEYNLRSIWNTVDGIHLGPKAQTILVDQQGRILAHPDKKKVFNNELFFDQTIIRDLQEGRMSTRISTDSKKQRWIAAYAPVEGLNWGLIIAQPYDEAFSLSRVLTAQSWILIVIATILAGVVGFLITVWVNHLVGEIIQAFRKMAQGDLSVSLPVSRRDELNRMKLYFNHMAKRLKKAHEIERLSIVGRSAASIAHELKNSLVLLKTFVQLIPQRHNDKAFVKEAADTIVSELDSWNNMLKNIMDFSKDPGPLNLKPLNINTLIEEGTLLMKLKAQENQISLEIDTKRILPLIQADEGKIRQVLLNLMANAFEATAQGGKIKVGSLIIGKTGTYFAGFEVFNSGQGIAPEDLGKIFEPFFTTKDHGLGLGLTISREIIHRHGGRLEADSQKDVGTWFRVILPVYINEVQKKDIYDIREDRRS